MYSTMCSRIRRYGLPVLIELYRSNRLCQYEVVMAEGVLSEDQAQSALDSLAARNQRKRDHESTEPHPTPQTSLYNMQQKQQDDSGGGSGDQEGEGAGEDDILAYEDMILNDRRYLCSIPRIPQVDVTAGNGTHNASPEDEEKELARATNRGWELLKSMDGNCLYFYSGWWSYSFCYGQGVRQFHQLPPGKGVPIYPPVEDKGVEAYILGRFDDPEGGKSKARDAEGKVASTSGTAMETGLAKLEQKGDVRYLVQELNGGTTCDLTGKERRIEVQVTHPTPISQTHLTNSEKQFRCQPNQIERIALIKETTTCAYLMIIDTPRLCNDVAFLPPQETKPHAIACTPVLPESSIPAYLAAKESADAAADAEDDRLTAELIDAINLLETGQVPLQRSQRDVVGEIEIGAHKFIPKDKKIEKGAIVGGGKEKFLATIAKKGGWIMPEKELHKIGIKGAKHVEELREEVERAAEGQGWRLDVVETPRGRELRGIIETEEVKDANEQSKQGKQEGGKDSAAKDEGSEQKREPQEGSEEEYKEEL